MNVRNGLTILYDDNSQSDFNQFCKFKIRNEHAHSCDPDIVQDIQCINPLGKSDHFMLEITCDFSTKTT